MRRLVEEQRIPIDVGDYDARTPLHLSSAEGHADVVQWLLEQGAPPNPRDRSGATPLDEALAARRPNPRVVDVLKRRGGSLRPDGAAERLCKLVQAGDTRRLRLLLDAAAMCRGVRLS